MKLIKSSMTAPQAPHIIILSALRPSKQSVPLRRNLVRLVRKIQVKIRRASLKRIAIIIGSSLMKPARIEANLIMHILYLA